MPAEKDAAPFTIAVDAGFAEDGVWVIDARLEFRDGRPQEGDGLLGRGRLALLEATAREGARGRALGAMRVRVRMSGHDTESITIGEPESRSTG
jgi:hypothetical protein